MNEKEQQIQASTQQIIDLAKSYTSDNLPVAKAIATLAQAVLVAAHILARAINDK